ncbi:DUF3071 domain-containing protein [Nakamurella silvestris]|nr:DUF3071 domain-containing protein [Nakamurella silvestris]
MRALRVLGLTDNGAQVVCEEPESGDQFALPTDERLTAAVRGDLSRLGQLEIEMQSQLRPREIQARVRAGASVEQVAAVANCEIGKVERFAYPVLMERSAMADRARAAHPVIDGLPAERTVEQLVNRTLAQRGQAEGMSWDSYREETGQWVLLLRWQAGRSENTARWAFHARSTGSTLTPYDETAMEIVDPAPRPLRTVRDLTLAEPPAVVADHPMLTHAAAPEAASVPAVVAAAASRHPSVAASRTAKAAPKPAHVPTAAQVPTAAAVPAPPPTPPPTAAPSPAAPAEDKSADPKPARKSNGRPAMPSWEDVLLGVRSSGH